MERALSPSANTHCTKCLPTVFPEVCSLCVCLWYLRSLPPRSCYTACLFISDSFFIGLCLSLSLLLSYKSQIGMTPEMFQHTKLIMAMIHLQGCKKQRCYITCMKLSLVAKLKVQQRAEIWPATDRNFIRFPSPSSSITYLLWKFYFTYISCLCLHGRTGCLFANEYLYNKYNLLTIRLLSMRRNIILIMLLT